MPLARSTSTTGGLNNNPYYTRAELLIFTPNFDRIAAGGVRFSPAFVGAPVCAPSRACLARHAHEGLLFDWPYKWPPAAAAAVFLTRGGAHAAAAGSTTRTRCR